MRYLPVSFDTKDKNALVLGGGHLALKKIKELLNTEFKIYVISDSFIDTIKTLSKENKERLLIKEEVLSENFIFFAYDYLLIATNNFELNSAFEKRAKKSNILYERCDILSESTMLLNRIIEKENISIALPEYNLNPTITDILYKDIEKLLESYNIEKINILNRIRAELIRKNYPDIDKLVKELYEKEKLSLDSYLNELVSKKEHFVESSKIDPLVNSETKKENPTDPKEKETNNKI